MKLSKPPTHIHDKLTGNIKEIDWNAAILSAEDVSKVIDLKQIKDAK